MSIIANSDSGAGNDHGGSADRPAGREPGDLVATGARPTPGTVTDAAVPAPIGPEPSPAVEHSPGPVETSGGSRRRFRPMVAGTVIVAAAAAAVAVMTTGDGGQSADAEPAPIRAVTAEQRDLVEFTDLDGTLGYASTRTVSTPVPGTITAVAADGATLERGDVVYEIDAEPVALFYGDVPSYRSLAEGDEGDDVELLEANLASLGHHLDQDADALADGDDEIDTGFTVDGVYDAATVEAVERWQADLGRPETGEVPQGAIVVVGGPAIASGIRVEAGSIVQTGAPVLELNVTGEIRSFHTPVTGELTLAVSAGPIATGQVLYVVDDQPITAVVTTETFERDLTEGDEGDDVRLLEELLVSLGHDARGDLVPDDEFDELTTEAVEDWEEDLQDTWDGVVVDGVAGIDQFVVVEPGAAVGSISDGGLAEGEVVATGSELFTWTGDGGGRVVTTAIDVAEQDKLASGTEVDVEFPDGTVVAGTVVEVATSSTVDSTDPTAEATLAVEIALPEVPESAAGLNELDVEIKLVDDLAAGATVVPASALVVTADGGYAVEVVDDAGTGATSFVAVEPGLFTDGSVEVTGIEPGTTVVVP